MHHPIGLLPAILLLCGNCGFLLAQDQASEPLTRVRQVRELSRQQLDEGRATRIEGTVVFSGRTGFVIHDGEESIQIINRDRENWPSFGEAVEVSGITGTKTAGGIGLPVVRGMKLTRKGAGSLPAPIEASVAEVARALHWEQWVSVEGVVVDQSWSHGELDLLLGGAEEWAVAHMRNVSRDDFSPDLTGAHVRLKGVNLGFDRSPSNALMVQDSSLLEVLKPGTEDWFSLEEETIEGLRAREETGHSLAHLSGIVVGDLGKEGVIVRHASGDVCRVTGVSPLQKPSPSVGESSTVAELPALDPGDRVEVAGFPVRQDSELVLRFSQIRLTAPAESTPLPIEVSVERIFEGGWINQLVQVRGRLAERYQVSIGDGRMRLVLVIEDEGGRIRAIHENTSPNGLSGLAVNDLVRVDGIVNLPDNGEPPRLVVGEGNEIASLGLAPSVALRRIQVWTGIALAVFAILGVWLVLLRRSVVRAEHAEGALRQINTTLEERVAERTSELEKARLDLDEALREERDLNQIKSRFISMVSHEFRTPLGVIMSALELLRHHLDRLDQEKRQELLDDIFSSTMRMTGMMEQILFLGKLEADMVDCHAARVDLEALGREVIHELESTFDAAGRIRFSVSGDGGDTRMDESLVRHVLLNLLSNAIKYSSSESDIDFRIEKEGSTVTFLVSDHGIGIPVTDQKYLFEAFHRASNVGDIPGTGLGLLLVKRCVEVHQGEISVDSVPGEGTTFTIRIPSMPIPG